VRGADPVDDQAGTLQWIDPADQRGVQLKKTTLGYSVIAVALLLLAVGLGFSVPELAALLLALCGPAIALYLLRSSPVGHIGIAQEQLLLVDHTDMYQLGGGPRVQYRGPFVLIDDVVVFTGNGLLPAFARKQVQADVLPLARAGVKVDRKTVAIKLLQCRHPLARGGMAVLACTAAALVLWVLQGIY
jgi:hypothetical protein